MKVTIKGPLRDTIAFVRTLKKRNRVFKKAILKSLSPAPMNLLAAALHPREQRMRITAVKQDTPSTRTYRLEPEDEKDSLAFFRAGQYITIEETVEGTPVSRPFSISSTPDEAAQNNFYEVTIKTGEDGFFAPWSQREWQVGTRLTCSEPSGTFYYEPLRDTRHVVCLAGGSGITPFRSILRDSLHHYPDVRFTLLYGVTGPNELIFGNELSALQESYPDRFSLVRVFSEETEQDRVHSGAGQQNETGFITAELIRKYIPKRGGKSGAKTNEEPALPSVFICGPPAMYDFVSCELEAFSLPPRRLREENYGHSAADPAQVGRDNKPMGWVITVKKDHGSRHAGQKKVLTADPSETVLTALERAGLNPPAFCRSGECGWCRSRLVSGEIYVPEENDGRRQADLKFGWFHPCSSYPRSDLVIEVPRNPIGRRR